MKINAHIKKIKATATRGEIYIGNKDKLSGSVYFGGRLVRSFDKTGWKKNAYDAYGFREDYDPVYYLSEKSDTLRYYTSLDVSDPDETFSLADIKSAINSSGYLYASAFGSGNTSDHKMYMSLDNAE